MTKKSGILKEKQILTHFPWKWDILRQDRISFYLMFCSWNRRWKYDAHITGEAIS